MARAQRDQTPAGLPGEMPAGTPNAGADHSFTLQAIMELQKATGKLEQSVSELGVKVDKLDLEAMRERVAKMEASLVHVATKADVASLESTLIKWFIGAAIGIAGLAFAIAKMVH